MDLPQRKQNCLQGYDYISPGIYFITVCTKNMTELFWEPVFVPDIDEADNWNIVGEITDLPQPTSSPGSNHLSQYGIIVETAIQNIPRFYPVVTVNKYVVMPNHVHLLIQIHGDDGSGRSLISPTEVRPTIMTIVRHLKSFATKQIGFSVWQRSFHDHIIRTQPEYQKIWQYIDQNPLQWETDRFHPNNFLQTP